MSRLISGRIAVEGGLLLLLVLGLSGCAAERLHQEGLELIAAGKYEDGVARLEQASKEEPTDLHFRTQYLSQRDAATARLLKEAEIERAAGHADAAEQLYRRVLVLDRENQRANAGLIEVARDRHHARLLQEAHEDIDRKDIASALARLKLVQAENPANAGLVSLRKQIDELEAKASMQQPTLRSMYRKPVSIEFYNANLRTIFDVLARTTGINFIFDKDVRPDLTASVSVKNTYLENVMDLLLTTSQLEKKILNSNTVLIYPNLPNKTKDYQDLVVKSFYLENADVRQTMNMVKTLLKTREIYIDEKLNMMVMRDTPETIRLVEKLIAMQDLAEPEVMLEVEVLEVTRANLLKLGIQYPDQLTLSPLSASGGTTLTLNDLKRLNSGRIGAAAGDVVVNAKSTDSDINLLANPRIRTRNREKANIMIGDRVPVITTTSGSSGFVSESVQYLDVGLKLEVEPKVYLQNDVAIRVALEVSSITNQVTGGKNGTLTYQIGTRTASTTLRLKDGETQVLAGLISDNDRASASKVPGLGQFPILGRLFSSHQNDNQKTEIVLSITPHLVRNINRPDAAASEFWSGSETTLRNGMLALPAAQQNVVDPAEVSATRLKDGGEVKPAPVVPPVASSPPAPVQDGTDSRQNELAEVDASRPPASISLAWQGPAQVKVGEQFRLALNLKADGGMRSLPFQIAFDASSLQVVEVVEGNFFRQKGGRANFTSNVDAAAGRVFVGAMRAGSDAVGGKGSVAFITFKTLTERPRSEIQLLSATPVGVGDELPAPDMPDPHVIAIIP